MTLVNSYKILTEAVALLEDDNLIWSDDFESIREPLAVWLRDEMRHSLYAADKAITIAKALIRSNDA